MLGLGFVVIRNIMSVRVRWKNLSRGSPFVITRLDVRHHSACRVMTNGDPRDGFFYPSLTRIMDSFACSPLFLFIYLCIYIF